MKTLLTPFPRIAHLPGSNAAADDLVMDADEASDLLNQPLVIFEKLDGLNVAMGLGARGRLVAEFKDVWRSALGGAVERALQIWMAQHQTVLRPLLARGEVLYGEWLLHTVSVEYTHLASEFVAFAYLNHRGTWLRHAEAKALVSPAGIPWVQPLWRGVPGTLEKVRAQVGTSSAGNTRMEGVVVERWDGRLPRYAKWVEPGYRHVKAGKLSGRYNALRAVR